MRFITGRLALVIGALSILAVSCYIHFVRPTRGMCASNSTDVRPLDAKSVGSPIDTSLRSEIDGARLPKSGADLLRPSPPRTRSNEEADHHASADFDNAIIYSPGVKVGLSEDLIVSSPSGVMVSNEDKSLIVGDLKIEGKLLDVDAPGAMVNTVEKTHAVGAPSITITTKSASKSAHVPSGEANVEPR